MPNFKTTVWSESAQPVIFSALGETTGGDLSVDVAIVGGGITGVTAALLLKRAGLRVAVLESRRIGSGETNKSTAHLTEVLDLRFRKLVSRFGVEGARLAVRGQEAAITRIRSFVDELGIDCDLQARPGYLFAVTDAEVRELDEEHQAASRIGLPHTVEAAAPLPFAVKRALRFEAQAQFHPRAYLEALAAAIPGDGSHVFEMTHVQDVTDGEPCRVETDRGVVTAREVIVASGVPVINRFLIHLKLAAYRSYAVAVANPAAAPNGLFWDLADPYHYVRTQVVGGVPYLIVGGEDHKVGERDDTTAAFDRLEAYVHAHFGRAPAATDYRWSGQIIQSADGLPYVGRNSLSKHVFVATGFAGNGITGGTLAALVLTDQIRHAANPWTELLDATRIKPLASAAAVVSENLTFPKHLIGDRAGRSARHDGLSAIAPGQGAVVAIGKEKLAVYRDGQGTLTALSPVCTHLGCHVRWNTAETTWDCPCHGSRFAPTGAVLNGPALQALQRKPLPDHVGEEDVTGPADTPPRPSSPRPPASRR
jgi:glycine/D-amino acid oxidase-like deaminating enzyme/nitrite reductase/ring-hydroxylating ferredoxin subunit